MIKTIIFAYCFLKMHSIVHFNNFYLYLIV